MKSAICLKTMRRTVTTYMRAPIAISGEMFYHYSYFYQPGPYLCRAAILFALNRPRVFITLNLLPVGAQW